MSIRITDSLGSVDGGALKRFYADSDFDNGRTADEHERSFRNSVVRLAFDGDLLVGAARAITDDVKTAAVFDVCVLPAYRGRGIARQLMTSLTEGLRGQFILLTCNPSLERLYSKVGFGPLRPDDTAMASPDDLRHRRA